MFEAYQACIDACDECISACSDCADACSKESHAEEMASCIQLDLECVSICRAARELMALNSNHSNVICQVCLDICIACAVECEKHKHMEHCTRCAAACRRCAEECASMVAA